jgi:hypothetical protein
MNVHYEFDVATFAFTQNRSKRIDLETWLHIYISRILTIENCLETATDKRFAKRSVSKQIYSKNSYAIRQLNMVLFSEFGVDRAYIF